LIHLSSHAQQFGANNAAKGVLGVATNGLFSCWVNPAQLHFLDSNAIGINLNRLSFQTPATQSMAMLGVHKNSNAYGLGLGNFGNSFYNLSQASLSYAKLLNPNQSLGFSIVSTREFIYLNDNSFSISANLGYAYQINSNLSLGVSAHRVFYSNNDQLEDNYTLISNRAVIGATVKASEELTIYSELEVDEANPLRVGGGVSYQLSKINLQVGLSSQQSLLNAGVLIPLGDIAWQLSYGFHQRLGNSFQTQLIYQW
jgi:hypothetical protein